MNTRNEFIAKLAGFAKHDGRSDDKSDDAIRFGSNKDKVSLTMND